MPAAHNQGLQVCSPPAGQRHAFIAFEGARAFACSCDCRQQEGADGHVVLMVLCAQQPTSKRTIGLELRLGISHSHGGGPTASFNMIRHTHAFVKASCEHGTK